MEGAKKAAAPSVPVAPVVHEPVIEEVTQKQLERILHDKDYVAVYWCKCCFSWPIDRFGRFVGRHWWIYLDSFANSADCCASVRVACVCVCVSVPDIWPFAPSGGAGDDDDRFLFDRARSCNYDYVMLCAVAVRERAIQMDIQCIYARVWHNHDLCCLPWGICAPQQTELSIHFCFFFYFSRLFYITLHAYSVG